MINESERDCAFICMGGGTNTGGGYSDIDLIFTPEGTYAHKDGTPYPLSPAGGGGGRPA